MNKDLKVGSDNLYTIYNHHIAVNKSVCVCVCKSNGRRAQAEGLFCVVLHRVDEGDGRVCWRVPAAGGELCSP